jgi:uncharacterized protein YwbE
MDGRERKNVRPGLKVDIVLKKDQQPVCGSCKSSNVMTT